ncbi:MAG: S8 family serine peptidase [Rhodoblastus sp.]|nr:S8 family serine peptidase [Rhodoblastus sp.]
MPRKATTAGKSAKGAKKQSTKSRSKTKSPATATGSGAKAAAAGKGKKAKTNKPRTRKTVAPAAGRAQGYMWTSSETSSRAYQQLTSMRLLPTATPAGQMLAAQAAALIVPPGQAPGSSDMLASRLGRVADTDGQVRELNLNVDAGMDPRLQIVVANHQTGKSIFRLSSTTGDEVAVVARVKSPEAWAAHSDVQPGAVLGKSEDGSFIVTGRVTFSRIQAVHDDENVISLKSSQSVQPELGATISAMNVLPNALPAGKNPGGGAGVVIGIVDFGCDFGHRNFRKGNGSTRLHSIWHQSGIATPTSPHGYGRVYNRADIDAALRQSNPYDALGYGPAVDTIYQTGTHGTHVMDIAAGNGLGSGQAGVAPEAELVFVELSASDIPWDGPQSVTRYFGDSVQLLEAVRYVFDAAGDRPCVCNLSLGTNGGPHDGSSLVERGLDAIVSEKPNRAIVIAASNSQDDGIHTSGEVPGNGAHAIRWRQINNGGGELELWYPGDRRLELTLVAEDGAEFGPVQPGANMPFGSNAQVAIFLANRLADPNNSDNVIGVWVAPGLPGSSWTLRLRSLDGQPTPYHAWIERHDGAQASFETPVPTYTLGSISTGHNSIVVGSYDAHKPGYPISSFSSCGPTRDGRNKPEVSAPGQNVLAARSRTLTGVVRKSGTSMAAPAITGLVALVLAEAKRNQQALVIADIRSRLLTSSAINPPAVAAGTWHERFGFGRAVGAAI